MVSVATKNIPAFAARPDVYEYLLVANPDTAISSQVEAEKQSFYERYEAKVAVKTKPHITVANFLAIEDMEETIGRWMQRICGQQKSFPVQLNNYSGFPPHTVYLRVQNPQPFQSLVKQLKVIDSYIRSYGCPPARLIGNPHLTVARRLPEEVYTRAMFDYARRDFHGSFIVKELVLLRRKHQFDPCERINVFQFLPEISPLVNSTQLSAF